MSQYVRFNYVGVHALYKDGELIAKGDEYDISDKYEQILDVEIRNDEDNSFLHNGKRNGIIARNFQEIRKWDNEQREKNGLLPLDPVSYANELRQQAEVLLAYADTLDN